MEKELIETDNSAIPIAAARANRLRRLRNLANLSRKEICQDSGINLNTLIGWEVARHGGLTQPGARKFLKRIILEGIMCSEEWLLHGTGIEPHIVSSISQFNPFTNPGADIQIQQILSEIALFKKHHPNAVSMIINDESMAPSFKKGDFICGCIISREDVKNYLGMPCILLTADGKQLFRNITLGEKEGTFCLLATNLVAVSQEPLILQDITPIYIAPVIWHRKLLKSNP